MQRTCGNLVKSLSRARSNLRAPPRPFPSNVYSSRDVVFVQPLRPLSSTAVQTYPTAASSPPIKPPGPPQDLTDISHSAFLARSSPTSDFNPSQTPEAGIDSVSPRPQHPWQGRLSPTTSHLFKLILPLPTSHDPSAEPRNTAFLLHPSQPLSHLTRLILGSLPPERRRLELTYLALTGQESDLDTHLRNAEEDSSDSDGQRDEGGPLLGERRKDAGRWQEVAWSQSTDLSDFIKQACLNERFKIVVRPDPPAPDDEKGKTRTKQDEQERTIEVVIPSFASRTTYLRQRLLKVTKELEELTKRKKWIDAQAHKGARRLAVAGLSLGAAYWLAVIRMTFFTDAGWDLMEPVTWSVGFGSLLGSVAFLAYHNREVSYHSLLDLSITARQRKLYGEHGLDLERWTEMVSEAKAMRQEISRIAKDYDVEWKGELENLATPSDKSIDECEHKSSSVRWAAAGSPPDTASSPSSPPSNAEAVNKEGNTDRNEEVEEKEQKEEPENEKNGKEKKLDIDKTIDEADELANETEERRHKRRKGEMVDDQGEDDVKKKREKEIEERGAEKARRLAEKGDEE